MGVPHHRWFTMDNPMKPDDLGVPLVQESQKHMSRTATLKGMIPPCLFAGAPAPDARRPGRGSRCAALATVPATTVDPRGPPS